MRHAGIELENMDEGVRAQDDLFRHVNGGWLSRTIIPEDRPLQGSFTALRDAAEENVREIITDAARARTQGNQQSSAKLGRLYASFMNEDAVNALGLSPIQPLLADVEKATNVEDVVALSGRLSRGGVPGLLAPFVNNDAGDPSRYLLHVYQSGLGLPDESYYREPKFEQTRIQYRAMLVQLMTLADIPAAEARAERVLDLETRLAAGHMDSVTCRNPQAVYNLYTSGALLQLSPYAARWLGQLGVSAEQQAELVLCQPEYLRTLAGLLEPARLDDWKDWLRTRILISAADYLPTAFVDAAFALYGTHLSGTPVIKERWKRGVGLVEGAMGEAIGAEYVARHFPAGHKQKMTALVENLLQAYRHSISFLTWMTDETRQRALEKLASFTTKIGYPDRWRDYSSLMIDDDLVGNVRRAFEFELQRNLDKLGQPIDREEWLITPQTVNAYYMPTMNEIVFPAAILQPPFFDAEADMAANYGGIGAVIGHEIGHGFDDQGSRFDGAGALSNWWTDADRAAFDALTARLVEQYSALSPAEAPGNTVNGELTLGENIGDLGGLTIAYAAYRISLDGAEPETIDGLTGDQRFFFSWAECWRQKIRPEEALRRLTVDPHSPNEFRCNAVVRNLTEFQEAFGVSAGDDLWLDAADRVRIW